MSKCEFAPCNEYCAYWERCTSKSTPTHSRTGICTQDMRKYKREWMRRKRAAELRLDLESAGFTVDVR